MAKEICMDCGKVFDGGAKSFFCMDGNEAYSKQQAERKNKKS